MKTRMIYLANALDHLEKRIQFVDSKVSILLALQGGLFLVFSLIVKEVFFDSQFFLVRLLARSVIGIYFWLLIAFGLKCIQIIRPSDSLWTARISMKRITVPFDILWPSTKTYEDPETFKKKISELSDDTMLQNYTSAILIRLQLLNKKYNRYRSFTLFFKSLFFYCAVAPPLLQIIKWVQQCIRTN